MARETSPIDEAIRDLGPLIPGELEREEDHFYPCPYCGQMVDQRDLRQVMGHEGLGHEPLEPEDGATILMFPESRN